MTIPTRDEALEALSELWDEAESYSNSDGKNPVRYDILRSYIESHTGEPVTYGVFDKTGKLRFVSANEHDAHMGLILSSHDPDEFDVETMVRPLFTSPLQPDTALTEALTRIEELEGDIESAIQSISGIRDDAQQVDDGILFSHGSDVLENISTALEYLRRATLTKGIKG